MSKAVAVFVLAWLINDYTVIHFCETMGRVGGFFGTVSCSVIDKK